MSDPNGKFFQECEASSEAANGQGECLMGLNGKMEDLPFSMWMSQGEGAGAWIKTIFKK